MDKYRVMLTARAFRDLDGIYEYIALHKGAPGAAENLIASIEDAILCLDVFPHRGAERKAGAYGGKGYRQAFVKNYTVIYRIVEEEKQVVVITVRNMRRR